MCLIVLAYDVHPRYKLILAANRDEYYRRPTAPAAFWADCPQLLAGRDLEGMGTWLGATRSGRYAALTNYRDPAAFRRDALSRGALVAGFLRGNESPEVYLQAVAGCSERYNPFNLLVGDELGLYYLASRTGEVEKVTADVHGLSNASLDTPWPKVTKAKAELAHICNKATEPNLAGLFAIMADAEPAPDAQLPDTGVGLDRERVLSPAFIRSPDYGTRCTTIVLIARDNNVRFIEKQYPDGVEQQFEFYIKP